MRGLDVGHMNRLGSDAGSEPATMTIEVELSGRRYLEDRDTAAVVAGSQSRAAEFTERWTLALEAPTSSPG